MCNCLYPNAMHCHPYFTTFVFLGEISTLCPNFQSGKGGDLVLAKIFYIDMLSRQCVQHYSAFKHLDHYVCRTTVSGFVDLKLGI